MTQPGDLQAGRDPDRDGRFLALAVIQLRNISHDLHGVASTLCRIDAARARDGLARLGLVRHEIAFLLDDLERQVARIKEEQTDAA